VALDLTVCATDGTRLYVTTSLLSVWDKQFYPDMVDKVARVLSKYRRYNMSLLLKLNFPHFPGLGGHILGLKLRILRYKTIAKRHCHNGFMSSRSNDLDEQVCYLIGYTKLVICSEIMQENM
jgi:hypothetical protein